MKISMASDHGGLNLKNELKNYLIEKGHEVTDCGTYTFESCDYPDFAYKAAKMVSDGETERAVVCCTSGVGVSMVCNKVNGVRCVLAFNKEEVTLSRQHNNANAISFGEKFVQAKDAKEMLDAFLITEFLGDRHLRRVNKIKEVEEKN